MQWVKGLKLEVSIVFHSFNCITAVRSSTYVPFNSLGKTFKIENKMSPDRLRPEVIKPETGCQLSDRWSFSFA